MFRERTFRIGLLPFLVAMIGVGLLAIVAYRLLGLTHRPLTDLGPSDWTLLGGLSLLAVAVWRIFPASVGPDGLRATDGIGRYHEVRWEDIRSVRSFSGFLWINHGKWGKALCTPKYVDDRFGLRDYVRRHAPEGNPLRTYLMSR